MPKLSNLYPFKTLSSQFYYLRALLIAEGIAKPLTNGKYSLNTPTCKAFFFIFYQIIQRYKTLERQKDGWFQITMKELNNRFKRWNSHKLEDGGLLIIVRESKQGKDTFKYRIPESILEGWNRARDFNSGYVNLMTGNPWTEQDESSLWAEQEKEWERFPERMKMAAMAFQESFFSRPGIEAHLQILKGQLEETLPGSKAYTSRRGELINDELCFASLLVQNAGPIDPKGIQPFIPRYFPLNTGRIAMFGGGLQSCTREMKLAAYGPLENMHNYDLSSSQVQIALKEMEKWNISCPWLEEYLANPAKRQECYEYIGIPKQVWKQCLSARLMGGRQPSSLKALRKDKEVSDDPIEIEAILKRLEEVLKPIRGPLEQWHRKILENLREQGSIINPMGLKLRLEDLKGGSIRGRVAAHILQGTEAYFIQELTLLAHVFGYRVIANEHDGIVVIGEIPKEAEDEAKRITGLDYMELETKQDFGAEAGPYAG